MHFLQIDIHPLQKFLFLYYLPFQFPVFWKELLNKGFISQEKYYRLMRKDTLTDEELASFINRQLVEARQSSKLVIGSFNRMYPNSKVAYVKANLVSDFKKRNGYKRSTELSKIYGLYRQDYCGCIYSKNQREREKKLREEEESSVKS